MASAAVFTAAALAALTRNIRASSAAWKAASSTLPGTSFFSLPLLVLYVEHEAIYGEQPSHCRVGLIQEILVGQSVKGPSKSEPVSYTHLRAHETGRNLVCRLLLEKKKKKRKTEQ